MLAVSSARAADPDRPRFRTDADGPYTAAELKQLGGKDKDDVLQWYQLVDGEFPPEGSAHAVSGELIRVDHVERRFQIRVDRNDAQQRGEWDLPLDAELLPYGSIYYRGAPAALQDIPLGTHLHGLFYWRHPDDDTPLPDTQNFRRCPEADFRRCFRIEDDFTHDARQNRKWHIDTVDLDAMKLTATARVDGEPSGTAKPFDLLSGTRVMRGRCFAELGDLQPGQEVLMNLTWVTLYGPGRITDIWLDGDSRELATAQQLESHREHTGRRGLAGWVTNVDDEKEIVTLTLFGGVDQSLLQDVTRTPQDGSARFGLAVARPSLMTYDPVNDRKRGELLAVEQIPAEPGSSGMRLSLKMDLLLEGYRPRRMVRLYPPDWQVIALPREEQYFGRE